MATIDQTLTWRKAEARLATETDPVLRRNLETLLFRRPDVPPRRP